MFPQTPPPVRFKAREKAFYPRFIRCSHLSSSHWLVVIFALAKVITSANQEKDSLRKALKGTKKNIKSRNEARASTNDWFNLGCDQLTSWCQFSRQMITKQKNKSGAILGVK